jgi:hypothetical protein
MNFEKTLRNSLMMYPSIHPNALTVYDHLFCVVGNGYHWEDGELVKMEEKEATLREAIVKSLNRIIDSDILSFIFCEIEVFGSEHVKKLIKHRLEEASKEVDMIFDIDIRMQDFSFETIDKHFGYDKSMGAKKYELYGVFEYSKICSLPDNIKKDWLEAAERFYNFMLEHKDRVEYSKNFIPQIGKRIKELKEKLYKV